jgi:hypothetical protein
MKESAKIPYELNQFKFGYDMGYKLGKSNGFIVGCLFASLIFGLVLIFSGKLLVDNKVLAHCEKINDHLIYIERNFVKLDSVKAKIKYE